MTMTVSPVPPGRRERKKAQTRKLISDTATRLFIERGFDHVTVKEVADAADVSPTTVFKHFPVKEALVFDEDPEQQAGLIAAVRDRPAGQSVPDALQAHLSEVRMFTHRDHPDLRAFLDLVNGTPALREYERQVLGRHEAALAQAIAASDQTIKDKPDMLRAFVKAALHGMKDIMDDPDQAATDFVKFVPEWNGKEGQVKEAFAYYDKLIYPGQKVLGAIDPERVAKLQDFYLAKGIIQKKTPVDDLFTNQFVM